MRKEKLPIIYNNCRYYSLEKFDCISISLGTYAQGGGYHTTFPISPLSHRKKNKTLAFVDIKEEIETGYTVFFIRDDWGKLYKVQIPSYMHKEITFAIESAKELQLLKNDIT